MKRILSAFSSLFIAGLWFSFPKTANAFSLELPSCVASGVCDLCDLVELFVNVSDLFLGLLGAVSLILFIYGGVWLLISAGNEQRITYGKKVIGGSIIGIIIVFSAFVIVNFIFWAMIDDANVEGPNVFSAAWFDGPSCEFVTGPTSCVGVNDGEKCGDNYICHDEVCKTVCDFVVEATESDPDSTYRGWSCKTISTCTYYNPSLDDFNSYDQCGLDVECTKNWCPGSDTSDTGAFVCCL